MILIPLYARHWGTSRLGSCLLIYHRPSPTLQPTRCLTRCNMNRCRIPFLSSNYFKHNLSNIVSHVQYTVSMYKKRGLNVKLGVAVGLGKIPVEKTRIY